MTPTTYGARPHANLPGLWVADDLFDTVTFGQATVAAPTLDVAVERFAGAVAGGSLALRPEAAR